MSTNSKQVKARHLVSKLARHVSVAVSARTVGIYKRHRESLDASRCKTYNGGMNSAMASKETRISRTGRCSCRVSTT
jgi:hypothetical protein